MTSLWKDKMMINCIETILRDVSEPGSYEMWLKPLKIEMNQNSVVLKATSDFAKNIIKERYGESIEKNIKLKFPDRQLELLFTGETEKREQNEAHKTELLKSEHVNSEPQKVKSKKSQNKTFFDIEPQSSDLKLNPKFTLDTFVVGKNNQLASAAAKAVINAPGVTYNPLFIYGGTGLGKTHLMQAIGHEIKKLDRRKKLVYVSCEEFTNLMIEAIQNGNMVQFRNKFRKIDVLMVDDIQFLAKKEQTQEEFFNTFNTLYNDHKQIILTSDSQPKEMTNLQKRLVSRFEWGLVTDIQPPTFETRISILSKKCELSKLHVPNEVIYFLSENIKDNVRQMEGALNRVYTYSKLVKSSLTVDFAREVLRDLIHEEKPKRICVPDVLKAIADFYGVSKLDLESPKRQKSIAFPRQVGMYLVRSLTELSLPEIGKQFGGRDHTTVMHACKLVQQKIQADEHTKKEIETITQKIITP